MSAVEDYAKAHKRPELVAEAEKLGVDTSGTKSQLAGRILAAKSAEPEQATEPEPAEPTREDDVEEGEWEPWSDYTVAEFTNFHDLAVKLGWPDGYRELAAHNGRRGGNYDLMPGEKVRFPEVRVPRPA